MDPIKWRLNFGSWYFGLKSYLWIQIELALRARSILKSITRMISDQIALHSVQLPLLTQAAELEAIKQSTFPRKLDITYATEQTFQKNITLQYIFSQFTNLIISNQFGYKSHWHDVHNGHAKSYYYDGSIGRLPGGGSLKITPADTSHHKESGQ